MKNNIILIVGQNKSNGLFVNSIKLYLSRNDITDIILVTWEDTNIQFVEKLDSIKKVLVSNKKFRLSIEYQKYLYDIGLEYINKNYKADDIYILKTRMDVFVSNHQLDYIFSQSYKINSHQFQMKTLFPYKIWIAWSHITKPFYIDDALFYSHISVMRNLSPYVGNLFEDEEEQGHSHIRWFLLLAREYNLYKEPNSYNHYEKMNSTFVLNETTKDILIKYRQCIKDHFIIKTLKDGITFRRYNKLKFYRKPSNKIQDIIKKKAISNLKIVYNDEDFFSVNL
jgi:hypothetical protein|tara:strand:- start:413 stop:1258 length:846 start_codon:yes stop_codon:yes gene_type:complete